MQFAAGQSAQQPKEAVLNQCLKSIIKIMIGFCKMSYHDVRLVEGRRASAAGGQAIGDADEEGDLNDLNTFLISFLESDED